MGEDDKWIGSTEARVVELERRVTQLSTMHSSVSGLQAAITTLGDKVKDLTDDRKGERRILLAGLVSFGIYMSTPLVEFVRAAMAAGGVQ